MHKALLLALATGLVVGTIAPDDKISVPILKKSMQSIKLPDTDDDGNEKGPSKLKLAQIKVAAAKTNREVSGVSDYLRLDARTMHVTNRGYLTVYFPIYIKSESNVIMLGGGGIVKHQFMARPRQTTYLVDYQLNVRSETATVSYRVDDQTTESSLEKGSNHVLLFVEANGGWQKTLLVVREGGVKLMGIEVSVVN